MTSEQEKEFANIMWYWERELIYDVERPLLGYLQKYPDDEKAQEMLEELYERMDLFTREMQEMEAQRDWEEHHSEDV